MEVSWTGVTRVRLRKMRMEWDGYQYEGPWYFVMLDCEVVYEKVEDAGDDN